MVNIMNSGGSGIKSSRLAAPTHGTCCSAIHGYKGVDDGPVFGGQITRHASEVVVLLPVDWLRGEIIQCEVRTVQNDDVLEI